MGNYGTYKKALFLQKPKSLSRAAALASASERQIFAASVK